MVIGPIRLAVLAALMAFGATGATLAAIGLGVPLLAAALGAAVVAGAVQYFALRGQPGAVVAPHPEGETLRAQLQAYRDHTAALRHDLRGVLSPALLMSDRLVNHADPAVQRAGTAVVRSIDRATVLLAGSRELMAVDPAGAVSGTPAAEPPAPAAPPQ